jgi:YbbR domain-containing protein
VTLNWFNTAHVFRTIILGQWEIKLVALFLAVLVWLYVVIEGTYYEEVMVPIVIEDIPEGMILANIPPSEALISIHGQGSALLRLQQTDCRAVVKVGNRQRERRSYSLSKVNVEAPGGIDIQEVITPKTIDVELDVPLEKALRVVNRVIIKPSEGYRQVGKVTIHPPVVKVYGPREVVRKMESLPTDSIVLTDIRKAISTTVALQTPGGVPLKVTPSEVVVKADIQEVLER